MTGGSFGTAVERSRIDDKDIHQSIIVVVENADSVSSGFQDVFLVGFRAGDVDGLQACLFRDVAEIDSDRRQIRLDGRRRALGARGGGHTLKCAYRRGGSEHRKYEA